MDCNCSDAILVSRGTRVLAKPLSMTSLTETSFWLEWLKSIGKLSASASSPIQTSFQKDVSLPWPIWTVEMVWYSGRMDRSTCQCSPCRSPFREARQARLLTHWAHAEGSFEYSLWSNLRSRQIFWVPMSFIPSPLNSFVLQTVCHATRHCHLLTTWKPSFYQVAGSLTAVKGVSSWSRLAGCPLLH
jgi:hypothetical protein